MSRALVIFFSETGVFRYDEAFSEVVLSVEWREKKMSLHTLIALLRSSKDSLSTDHYHWNQVNRQERFRFLSIFLWQYGSGPRTGQFDHVYENSTSVYFEEEDDEEFSVSASPCDCRIIGESFWLR